MILKGLRLFYPHNGLRAVAQLHLDQPDKQAMSVVILAGGLATRLRPITETIPKSLVEVAGEPFVVRQLRYLKSQGISTVVMCIGYLGEMIQSVVGDGQRYGIRVVYSMDGPKLLGTGGAIRQALQRFPRAFGQAFFVLYGDSYLPIDFGLVQNAFEKSGKPALMTVLKNKNEWDKSNVLFKDHELVEYNKLSPNEGMAHIDYGLSVLTPKVLDHYALQSSVTGGGSFDLADVFHKLSKSGQLAGHEVQERFYEIGSHTGLKEATDYFSREDKQ